MPSIDKIRGWKPPTSRELRTKVFLKHPFHCEGCGKVVDFRSPVFIYHSKTKSRIMLQSQGKEALCGNCLSKRIHRWFDTPIHQLTGRSSFNVTRVQDYCDCCHNLKIVSSWINEPWCDVRFGTSCWNSHSICCDCLIEAAEKGSVTSSIHIMTSTGNYYMNEVGAMIRGDFQ